MKKPKHKKKLNKRQTAEVDPTTRFMEESSKEAADAGLQPLELVPQGALGTNPHRE